MLFEEMEGVSYVADEVKDERIKKAPIPFTTSTFNRKLPGIKLFYSENHAYCTAAVWKVLEVKVMELLA